MKKMIIGTLVGAVILFLWSFLSWAILPIHLHTYMYTPAQDAILKVMADNQMETGAYYMPMVDNRNVTSMDAKYHDDSEKLMKESAGKPMASIFYIKEGYNMDGSTIARGFLFNLIAVFSACIILMPAFSISNSFFSRWWLTLVTGLLINTVGPLIQYNWMGMPWGFTMDMVMDNFLNWGIVGLWLAFYFKPGK